MFLKGLRNAVSLTKFNFTKMSTETNLKPNSSRKPETQFMKVTESAKSRILELMKKKNDQTIVINCLKKVGLKISLTKKGCNGLTYNMNYVNQDSLKKFDEIVDLHNGVKVIIDSKAIMAIVGTELDYV
jgi:iron-sulfur cluster assembly protein